MGLIMRSCFGCGSEVPFEQRVPRDASCEKCDRDLHCCRNCRFHDPALNNQCAEPQAEWVSDKERANFCDLFVFAEGDGGRRGVAGEAGAARADWKKLFGEG